MTTDQQTITHQPGQKVHQFELAGLGAAPYKFIGARENLFVAFVGAPPKPGGSCDYCGQGIRWEYWLQAADGRKFKVGCDCIMKTNSSKALIVAVKTERQKREAEQRKARAAVADAKARERIAAAKAKLPEVAAAWREQPHPMAGQGGFFAGKTLLDWAEWMLWNAGLTGQITVARKIEQALGGSNG